MTAPNPRRDSNTLPLHYFDDVVETYLRATSYQYGAGHIGIGVQITLEQDGVVQAVRLPMGNARDLAVAILSKIDPARLVPPDADTRTEWATRLAAIDGYEEDFSRSFEGAGSTEEERAHRRAEVWSRRFGAEHVDVMRRTILVGPWVPVSTTPDGAP